MGSTEQSPAFPSLSVWIKSCSADSPLLHGTGRTFPSSRWHELKEKGSRIWLKRDDELSWSMSGPKFRKLCSLHEALAFHAHIVSYGSARSAFLLALSQYAKEVGKTLELFLLRSTPYADFGTDRLYENAFAAHTVHWINREDWPRIADFAEARAAEGEALFLPEGGASAVLLPGALSLALDVAEQLSRVDPVSAIWIDAGSGFTAQSLILGLGTLLVAPPRVHVVLCAGNEKEFAEGLAMRRGEAARLLACDWRTAPYTCHRPPSAASYGATNTAVWQTIARYQHDHGVILDPIYTAKLMMTFEAAEEGGSALIIHSGGGLNNFGFRDGLRLHREG